MKKLLLPVLFALTILSCTKGETPEGGDETQSGGQTEQPQQPEQPQPEDPQQPEQPQQPENPEQGGISGAGTETSPYILKTADDFKTVRGLITPATTTYIQLAANINMSGVTDYVPFNHEEPFDRQIHFDGKGHTISNFTCSDAACPYPSIFGVLYGSCRDLNVERPSVTATGQVCGVIAGYVGTAGKPGLVEKVTVQMQ